jgi:hypothetical protein
MLNNFLSELKYFTVKNPSHMQVNFHGTGLVRIHLIDLQEAISLRQNRQMEPYQQNLANLYCR